MRLYNFIKLSSNNKNINVYRSLDIGLVSEDKYSNIVKKIQEEYDTKTDVINLIDGLNKQLKRFYKGKLKFGFCLDEKIKIDKIKIDENKLKKIKESFFDINDKMDKSKRILEKRIKEGE